MATEQDLIKALQELAEDLGETPTTAEMNEQGRFSMPTYYTHFESWNVALDKAGLNRNSSITREDLIDDLQEIQSRISHTPPLAADIEEHTQYSLTTYHSKFDNLNEAREAANLNTNTPSKTSREEILSEIQRLSTDGVPPTTDEMDEQGTLSARTCMEGFGSWNAALEEAGFEPHVEAEEATREDLLDEIRRLHDEFGRPPSTRDMRDNGKYPPSRYFYNFESWNSAISEAGFSPYDRPMDPKDQRISPSKLLAELRRVGGVVGNRPTCEDMEEHGKYSPKPYQNRFDSWNRAVDLAGYTPFTGTSEDIYSREELLAEIQRVADELGRPPTIDNMENYGTISRGPFARRFGSWIAALRAAGLEPTEDQLRGHQPPE